jgi:RNase P subunit RPR2
MKPDYMREAKRMRLPIYDKDGVPRFELPQGLAELWLKREVRVVICQTCRIPFLVFKDFGGDPPYHNCIGDSQVALEEGDIGVRVPRLKMILLSRREWDDAVRLVTTWFLVNPGLVQGYPMSPLSPEEYADIGGLHCPACRASSIDGHDWTVDSKGQATWKCTCNECGASWIDIYQLTGYANLELEEPLAQ